MTTTAVIFTHPPDYVAARYAAECLRRAGARPVLALDEHDPHLRVDGIDVIRTSFPRVGNLNGMDCVRGILQTLDEQAGTGEYVLKVDSDTLVMSLDWLKGRTETAVGMNEPTLEGRRHGRALYGMCYALKVADLPELRAAARYEDRHCSEDIRMGELAAEVGTLWTWRNRAKGTPFAAYSWRRGEPVEWWKERYQALVFQRTHGNGHREVAAKMKEFLE